MDSRKESDCIDETICVSGAIPIFDAGGAEIVAYDPDTQRLFVVNAEANRLDVLDIRKPSAPARASSIDLAPHGGG